MSGFASALSSSDLEVKFDGDKLSAGSVNDVDKNDEYEVRVRFTADAAYEDVQVSAYLRGDDFDDDISDVTDSFKAKDGVTYTKKLTLNLPHRMERDNYELYVRVESRDGDLDIKSETFDLEIDSEKHDVVIKDVVLSPANGVVAGRALLATVRLQNYGKEEEDDVKVTFSIPDLGVAASDYIDELEEDGEDKDSKSTEELYLRIPECADAGAYDAEVEVKYNDGDDKVSKDMTVVVLADETCDVSDSVAGAVASGKALITIGPESQDVAKGAGGVVYPVTITNTGNAKTFVVSVTGGDWGTFRVSPSNVVTVGKDETKSVYVYAAAKNNAPVGEQVFGVSLKSGDSTVKEVTLKANVVAGSSAVSLKRVLEVGLIVLVVILVILGLIIGFNKLKGSDEEKEEGESYY
jgi:hypothetical protein